MPLESGNSLGTYEIIEPAGVGETGKVYLAKDDKPDGERRVYN